MFRKLSNWLEDLAALQIAILGVSAAVIGTYVQALPEFKGDVWAAFQRLFVLGALLGALVAGMVLLMIAAIASSQGKSPRKRIATLFFVIVGIIFIHALGQLEREQYLQAIIPVLAAVLTAWGLSAFRGTSNKRSSISDRFAPRP